MFCAGEYPAETRLEPLLTLWSPTAKIETASFPNIDLRPPGNISSLLAVPCIVISETQDAKEPETNLSECCIPQQERTTPIHQRHGTTERSPPH